MWWNIISIGSSCTKFNLGADGIVRNIEGTRRTVVTIGVRTVPPRYIMFERRFCEYTKEKAILTGYFSPCIHTGMLFKFCTFKRALLVQYVEACYMNVVGL